MATYDYRVVTVDRPGEHYHDLEMTLKEYGKAGWRLAWLLPIEGGGTLRDGRALVLERDAED